VAIVGAAPPSSTPNKKKRNPLNHRAIAIPISGVDDAWYAHASNISWYQPHHISGAIGFSFSYIGTNATTHLEVFLFPILVLCTAAQSWQEMCEYKYPPVQFRYLTVISSFNLFTSTSTSSSESNRSVHHAR